MREVGTGRLVRWGAGGAGSGGAGGAAAAYGAGAGVGVGAGGGNGGATSGLHFEPGIDRQTYLQRGSGGGEWKEARELGTTPLCSSRQAYFFSVPLWHAPSHRLGY